MATEAVTMQMPLVRIARMDSGYANFGAGFEESKAERRGRIQAPGLYARLPKSWCPHRQSAGAPLPEVEDKRVGLSLDGGRGLCLSLS